MKKLVILIFILALVSCVHKSNVLDQMEEGHAQLVSGETWGETRTKINETDTRVTALESAIDLKQDASTAATDSELSAGLATKLDEPTGTPDGTKFAADDGTWKTPSGSTITADGTDPTKAAVAVLADSATTAGACTGNAATASAMDAAGLSGTIDDARIPTGITRDSELASATVSHASTADSATTATTAGSAAALEPVKTDGVPGMSGVYEAAGTGTDMSGFIGADTQDGHIFYKFPGTAGTNGQVLVQGTPLTGQTLPNGDTATIIPLSNADQSGGTILTDGNAVNDILVWDGTSYEPMAFTSHPAYTTLLNAFLAAGLNTFNFSVSAPASFPHYVSGTSVDFDMTITDTSSTYDPDSLQYQVDSGGYTGNDCTDTSNCDSIPLTENASNTIQFQVSDDKSPTPNTGESAEYIVISDTVAPVIVAGADSTHNGVDTFQGTFAVTESYPVSPGGVATVTNATPTNPTVTCDGSLNCETEALTPDGTGDVYIEYSATDLAGNEATGTDLEQIFTYSGGVAYVIEENFEGTGYDGSLTPTETPGTDGTIDPDYTTTVLKGSQSLNFIGGAASTGRDQVTLASDVGTVRYHMMFRINALPTQTTAIFQTFDSGLAQSYTLNLESTGRINLVATGGTTQYGSTLSTDTTYHIWIDLAKGTGSDASFIVSVGTDTNFPGTPDASMTNSTINTDIHYVRFAMSGYSANLIFDQILMSETAFATVP